MRQEENNTFEDGLIKDLNPINTPNTVLTDNLNGTIITYDGNEFNLQNDRGNYALQNCKLKPNYIPIGVKEYADTLYIVSYNPLDDTTEIGSYPSPLEISETSIEKSGTVIESLVKQSENFSNYTDLIQRAKLYVFSDENLKINPGDDYQINIRGDEDYIYEDLEYYIIDENRNKYNISDSIKKNNNFTPVGWTIPGWLAVQYKLASFEDFIMNIRSLSVPELAYNSNGDLELNFQLKISDDIILNRINNHRFDEIGLNIKIQQTTSNTVSTKYIEDILFSDLNCGITEWYENSKILWAKKKFTLKSLNQGDKISIISTPFIKVTIDNKDYKIIYDNLTSILDTSIANVGSYTDFSIADRIWKFWIEEDDPDNLYLEFNISGPAITSDSVNLYYKINKINGNNNVYTKVESYNGIGQNTLQIPFDEFYFKPEGIYTIELILAETNPELLTLNKHNHYSIKKLIIASQIFSDFVKDVPNFENITFNDWAIKYTDSIKNADKWDISVDSDMSILKSYSKGVITNNGLSGTPISDCLKDFWTTKETTERYNHTAFITEDEWDDTIGEQTKFIRGYTTNAKITLNTELEVLNGELWEGMNRTITLDVTSHDNVLFTNSYNINNIKKTFNLSVNPIIGTSCDVTYNKVSEGLVRGSTSKENSSKQVNPLGIRYGIIVGGNNKNAGTNWISTLDMSLINSSISENGSTYPKRLNTLHHIDIGSKSSMPNGVSREIVRFMTQHKLPFMIMFVVARPLKGSKAIGVARGGELMFHVSGDNVSMQPFVVFINKQNNPIFFTIDGYDYEFVEDAKTGQDHHHDFPFEKWTKLQDFVKHMNSTLNSVLKYDIKNITDGYFINCNYTYDESTSVLNLETNINISEVTEWFVAGYNLLNAFDRNSLKNYLQQHNINSGNLLTGTVSKLDAMSLEGLEYNNSVQMPPVIKSSIHELLEQIDYINSNAKKQWNTWKTDEAYKHADNVNITGSTLIDNDNTVAERFKESPIYALIQKAEASGNMIINATGDKLLYKVVEADGGYIGQESRFSIGSIHPSITFP